MLPQSAERDETLLRQRILSGKRPASSLRFLNLLQQVSGARSSGGRFPFGFRRLATGFIPFGALASCVRSAAAKPLARPPQRPLVVVSAALARAGLSDAAPVNDVDLEIEAIAGLLQADAMRRGRGGFDVMDCFLIGQL